MECKFCGKAGAEWQAEDYEDRYCDQECCVAWHLEQMVLLIESLIDQRFR